MSSDFLSPSSTRNLIEEEIPAPKSKLGRSLLCNPLGTWHRFFVFIFMCFLSFGNYFCFDTPSALQSAIESDLGVSNEDYGLLYSVYSWPNVILSFLGGYLIDRYLGIRWGAIIFAAFITLGQFVVATGAYWGMFNLMVVGRFIFAIGGESLAVAQNTYTVKWFKGQELNTVFGIQLSFARIGSSINQFTMYRIYEALVPHFHRKTLGISLFIAFLTTLVSLSCGFILWYFDKRRDTYLELKKQYEQGKSRKRDSIDEINGGDALFPDEIQRRKPKQPFSMMDILRFPPTMWLLCVICVTFYAAIFPLVSFGQLFYVSKFELNTAVASIANGIIYFVAIPASLVSGLVVDYFGRNVLFIIFSTSAAIFGHCLLAFSFITPFLATVILGCAYSLLAASLWPSVAYVVPERAMATAYGVMQSIQNFGLAILFILIGIIVDNYGYLILELFFIAVLSCALAVSILLYFVDYSHGGHLSMDGRTRKEKLKSQ